MPPRVIEHIVGQHAEDAAFLWLQRDQTSRAHDRHAADLARLDERLEAHVDGLRIAGEWGWDAAQNAFDAYREPGETFVAAVLAFEGRSENRIGYVLNAVEDDPDAARAIVSALGWVEEGEGFSAWVDELLRDPRPGRRLLGVSACSVRRVDPGSRLALLLEDVPSVRARALRLAGELGRADLAAALGSALADENPECRFWAAWSATLVGDRNGGPAVLRERSGSGPAGMKALDAALRAMAPHDAAGWLLGLRGDPTRERMLAAGAGVLGDPALVPWLITRMRDRATARLAAESFSSITGIALADHGLEAAMPDDGLEHDLAPDDPSGREEGLPWPDARKVRLWWRENGSRFRPGTRYLGGAPVTRERLLGFLAAGSLRMRRAAALELALAEPASALFNSSRRASSERRADGFRF
jgi:uncharacterized protein (TIGR02270 family)